MKENYLYLLFIAVFAFLILNFNRNLPIDFYSRGGEPFLPVVVGILIVIFSFLIFNRFFGHFVVFLGLILMVTSGAFVLNFSRGMEINFFTSFSLDNLMNVIYLIPFNIFLIFYLGLKRDLRVFYPVICLASVFFTALGVFLLASSCIAGISFWKEEKKKEYEALISFLLVFVVIFSIFIFSGTADFRTFIISTIFSAILAAVIFASDKEVNDFLLVCVVFISILGAFDHSSKILTLDDETLGIIEEIKILENYSIVSTFENKLNSIIKTNYEDGLRTFFGDEQRVKYLALDRKVIEKPFYYSSKINASPQFETFVMKKKEKMKNEFGEEYYVFYYYSEKSELILVGDEKVFYRAYLNGIDIDVGDLFKFGEYFILPKKKGNSLKILFPENFGGNSTKIFENSRYYLFEIG